MDHAAATPVDARVAKVMRRFSEHEFGNPSSIHSLGVSAKRALEEARKKIANTLNCRPQEIVFTSGGTEGNNLAILGVAKSIGEKYKNKRGHIIVSAIEHESVLAPCRALEKEGFNISYLPVSKEGIVDPEEVKKALRPDTVLVSIMYANNEIGTIQPISEIAKVLRRFRRDGNGKQDSKFIALSLLGTSALSQRADRRAGNLESCFPLLHVDACQAPGLLPLNVAKLGVDLMTLSGSKAYGPKGVGCLYIKTGTPISPIIYGGGQEGGLRSGTENVAGAVGIAEALAIAEKGREAETKRLTKLRNYSVEKILKIIPGADINGFIDTVYPMGYSDRHLSNNINIYIPGVINEQLVIELDAIGVSTSSGSACHSRDDEASHVIKALGYSEERAQSSVRFSLGRSTTKQDIDYVLKELPEILKRINNKDLV